MHKLLILLLSLIFISASVSAIVITTIDDNPENTPITINSGENITISLIKEELTNIKKQLVSEIEVSVLDQVTVIEGKIDNYFLTIIQKIGLGFLSIALLSFNFMLAKKLFLEMVFKDA